MEGSRINGIKSDREKLDRQDLLNFYHRKLDNKIKFGVHFGNNVEALVEPFGGPNPDLLQRKSRLKNSNNI